MKSVVVTPTYNEAANIPELVGQLFALGVAGLELLVVDDASGPDSEVLLSEIASMDAVLSALLTTLGSRERLVVIASDHGEGLWDHRHHPVLVDRKPPEERTLSEVFFRDHSFHLYQELIRR